MTIPTRILRATANDNDPHPRQLSPREQERLTRIRFIGQKMFTIHGPQNISFAQFAEAIDVSTRALKHYYVDLHALLGDLIRTHLLALSAALGQTPLNAQDRAAKLRKTYYDFTRQALGGLTDAHLLTIRDTHKLPDDERISIEAILAGIGKNIADEAATETMSLLNTPYITLERIETLLAPTKTPILLLPAAIEPEPEAPEAEPYSAADIEDRINNPGGWIYTCGIPLKKTPPAHQRRQPPAPESIIRKAQSTKRRSERKSGG